MKCPYCGEVDSKVIDSRPTEDGEKIRRRRECLNCKKRFTTYEIVETVPLMVVKKDRSREVFDRQKLLNGMLRACEKRPVSYTQLDAAVDRIEQQLLNSYDRGFPPSISVIWPCRSSSRWTMSPTCALPPSTVSSAMSTPLWKN